VSEIVRLRFAIGSTTDAKQPLPSPAALEWPAHADRPGRHGGGDRAGTPTLRPQHRSAQASLPGRASLSPVSRYYAEASRYHDGTYTLVVIARADGAEVWGDSPLPAARWQDIPSLGVARLARTAYTVVGEWREHGDTWTADAEVV
jgi:hypothetical protein